MLNEDEKNTILNKYENRFVQIKNGHTYSRLGKTFSTKNNKYFLDTGTGKVLKINDDVFNILNILYDTNEFKEILQMNISYDNLTAALDKICDGVINQHILQAFPVESMVGPQTYLLENDLNNCLRQITLEVTERCNLRCDYCIYNDDYKTVRKFGYKDMSYEVAQLAIDDLAKRSKGVQEVGIGFYGGEPLLRFDFIVKCIEYAKTILKNKKLFFAMTSNLTLMTQEMAEYFADLDEKFLISGSIDGSKNYHDMHRKYPNEKGSFDDALVGLRHIVTAYNKKNKLNNISLSAVISPPYYFEQLNSLQQFIQKTEWLPNDLHVTISHQGKYQQPIEYMGINSPQEKSFYQNGDSYRDPIKTWHYNHKTEERRGLISKGNLDKSLYKIHDRPISDTPRKSYPLNGCCVPFSRKAYVTVDGTYLICEKVGNIPSGGTVYTGLDIPKIKKIYVDDYIANAKKYCGECWAVNLCSQCYVDSYDENGVNFGYRHKQCRYTRYSFYRDLIEYHQLLEDAPDTLEYLNDIKYT